MSSQEFRPSRFQILPPVVKNLLIINGIMFLATTVIKDKFDYDLADFFGLHFPTSEYFRPHQYLTHLFMHGSLMHVISNMFALWMFGNVLENFWGPKRFLIYYLVTGLGAALIHTLFTWYEVEQVRIAVANFSTHVSPIEFKIFITHYIGFLEPEQINSLNTFFNNWQLSPTDPTFLREATEYADMVLKNKVDIPTVGASGAVFGVLLAFGMLFPNTIIYLYFAIPVKAKWFVLFYGLFELYSGVQNSPTDNVAHFAHLGGMLFGFFLIKAWRKNRFQNFE